MMTSKLKLMTNWIGCTIARVSSTAWLKASRRSLTGCIGAQNWCTWKTAPPESRSLHKITIAQIATAQIAGQIILGDKLPLSRSKVDALFMALIWGGLDKVLAMISNLRNLWESWKLFLNHHYIWGRNRTRIQMICYPHPFYKGQNQDSALLWDSTPWVELRWNWGVGLLSRMQGQ